MTASVGLRVTNGNKLWGFGPGGAGNNGPMVELKSANAKLTINSANNSTTTFNNKATRTSVRINDAIALQQSNISTEVATQFIEAVNPVQFVIEDPELPETYQEYYAQYRAWLGSEPDTLEESSATFESYLLEIESEAEEGTADEIKKLRQDLEFRSYLIDDEIDAEPNYGFIAEDLQQINPLLTKPSGEEFYTENILALLTIVVKQQQERIAQQESRIEELEVIAQRVRDIG